MIELVNTSLPKGLLPGSSGFATVAMTRGTPDAIRTALDGLSSYRHRVSAKGESYWAENPVVWSHLVLPQGGAHVLSCVRAAEFDYSGRTNRQARHWHFLSGEFPADANAADIIAANAAQLSAIWKGDARWLEAGESRPSQAARPDQRAAAFIGFYGAARGPALAAQWAACLRAELQGANRPILFRTSQAWDPDGTRLLGLFADVIALLPPQLRGRATFCTYPAALPGYFACTLRGSQPDDPNFAALSAGRPWFDCATGAVCGAPLPAPEPELLELASRGRPMPKVASVMRQAGVAQGPSRPAAPAYAPGSAPRGGRTQAATGRAASQNRGAPPPASQWLPEQRRDNSATLYAILGGCVAVVVIASAFFCFLQRKKPVPPVPPPEDPAGELRELASGGEGKDSGSAFGEKPLDTSRRPKAGAGKEDAPKPTPPATQADSGTADVPQRQPPEATRRDGSPHPSEEQIAENKETAPEPPPPAPEWEFTKATKLLPDKPIAREFGKGFWYFYGQDGKLQEAVADPKSKGVAGTVYQNEPDAGSFCILYGSSDGAIWFGFPTKAERFFATADEVDLQCHCFGPDRAVFETWKRLAGGKVLYEVSMTDKKDTRVESKSSNRTVWTTDAANLTLQDAIAASGEAQAKQLKAAVEAAKKAFEGNDGINNRLKWANEHYANATNILAQAQAITNDIAQLERQIKDKNAEMKEGRAEQKSADNEIEGWKKQQRGKEDQLKQDPFKKFIENMTDNELSLQVKNKPAENIDQIKRIVNVKKDKLDKANKAKRNADAELERAEKALNEFNTANAGREKAAREASYTVTPVRPGSR